MKSMNSLTEPTIDRWLVLECSGCGARVRRRDTHETHRAAADRAAYAGWQPVDGLGVVCPDCVDDRAG